VIPPDLPIKFGSPFPPPSLAISNPVVFMADMLIGFAFLLGITVVIDKLGTAMFQRGFAKPFYIKGHRIHHSVIYMVVTVAYGMFSVFYFFGYIRIIWNVAWDQFAIVTLMVAACMVIDAIGDKFWPEIRKNVILHHEWVYSIIPAYILASSPMLIIVI
jgi:hypothetical protein